MAPLRFPSRFRYPTIPFAAVALLALFIGGGAYACIPGSITFSSFVWAMLICTVYTVTFMQDMRELLAERDDAASGSVMTLIQPSFDTSARLAPKDVCSLIRQPNN